MPDSGSTDLPTTGQHDDRGPSLVIFSSFMVAISVISLSLRFVSRGLVQRGQRFWWDDWVALLSLPFILGLMVTIFSMVSHGLGRRIAFVSEEDRTEFFKYLFAGYFTYDIALAITKCSALLFFSRVFPRRQNSIWFNMSLYTIHALNAGWLIGIIAGTIWICRPIAKNWIPAMEGECGPPSDLWIGSAVPSAFIDLLILLLPLPKVWSLQLSRVRRFGIIGVFLLGYGVIVVSLGRVITTFKQADAMDADLTYEMPPVLFWVGAEAPVTLVSICLPAMLPLFRHLASKISPRFKPYSTKENYAAQGSSFRSRTGNFGATVSSNQGIHMRSVTKSADHEEHSIRSEGSWKGILAEQETTARIRGPDPSAPRAKVPEKSIMVERNIVIDREG